MKIDYKLNLSSIIYIVEKLQEVTGLPTNLTFHVLPPVSQGVLTLVHISSSHWVIFSLGILNGYDLFFPIFVTSCAVSKLKEWFKANYSLYKLNQTVLLPQPFKFTLK